MNQDVAALCADCKFGRRITNRHGSVFLVCEQSKIDTEYVKYPSLPVPYVRAIKRENQSWIKNASAMRERPFVDLLKVRLRYGFEDNLLTDQYYNYNTGHTGLFDLVFKFSL